MMQFTDDPFVKETLTFLMTREITHYQQFEAALASIQPNFPPGILQGDPRYSNLAFNMSEGEDQRGSWNKGTSTRLGEEYRYITDPVSHVKETNGLTDEQINGTARTIEHNKEKESALATMRGNEIKAATPMADMQWSTYSPDGMAGSTDDMTAL